MTTFEDGATFDLSVTQSFCSLAPVVGYANTYAATSLWCASVPSYFISTCGSVVAGLLFQVPNVEPGDQFSVQYWQNVPGLPGVSTDLLYNYPATGVLPPNDFDLVYVGGTSVHMTTPGAWEMAVADFELNANVPWPADVYFLIQTNPDDLNFQPTYIDDVTLVEDINTSIPSVVGTSALSVAPNPAHDRLSVLSLSAEEGKISVFNSTGVCVTHSEPVDGIVDVAALAPGAYVLRQGAYWIRFVKD